ncbi:MAG: endonuclease/exonuclease/phosphatase family protein [Phycisphaerales bacterium]
MTDQTPAETDAERDARPVRSGRWWRLAIRAARWGASAMLVAFTALLMWTERPYLLDLAAQFGVLGAIASAIVGAALLALRRDGAAFVGVLATVIAWGVLLRDYRSPVAGASGGTALRIVLFNAHGYPLTPAFLEWVESEGADVLCIVESPPALFGSCPAPIAALEHALPAGPSWRASDSVFSRYPFEVVWPTEDEIRRRPALAVASRIVMLDLGGGERILLTTQHPPSPRTPRSWRTSWERSARWGEQVRSAIDQAGTPGVVAGDMNSTPTGRTHRAFANASGLSGWTPLFGAGTWPADKPRWLSLPIDRIWTTPGVVVTDYTVGPASASDHRPVAATVVFPAR